MFSGFLWRGQGANPFCVSNLFVGMYLQHIEVNIEIDDNDLKEYVFVNGQWENPVKLNVSLTCSGHCGHETLLEHVITEASLMT